MATAARFGRLPRSAPSLTGTIVALAQQYQAQRDQNIEAAWKNGGIFEGKKVTDEMVLKYWKTRLGETSPDDPMHDYYTDQIYGIEFNIAESKMGLKYERKQVTDAQMADFYMEWANKMPVNSMNYRNLATQAAKFKSAALARGRGNGARAAAEAYNRAQLKTQQKNVAPFKVAQNLVSQFALQAGIILPDEYNTPDFGWDLLTTAGAEHDPSEFKMLVSNLMENESVREEFTRIMRLTDPGFDGTFDEDSFARLAQNAKNGLRIMYNRALAGGHKEEANGYKKEMDKTDKSYFIMRVMKGQEGTSPTRTDLHGAGAPGGYANYPPNPNEGAHLGFMELDMQNRAAMDAVLNDPNSSSLEKGMAKQTYENFLRTTGTDLYVNSFPPGTFQIGSPNFNVYANGYLGLMDNTLQVLNGQPPGGFTLKDGDFGFGKEHAGESSDAATLSATSMKIDQDMWAVATGKGIEVQTDGKGHIVPDGPYREVLPVSGPEVQTNMKALIAVPAPGVASTAHYNLRDAQGNPVGIVGGLNGQATFVVSKPIKVAVYGAQDPRTGEMTGDQLKLAPGQSDTIGQYLSFKGPDGRIIEMYGAYQGGRLVWSYQKPWVDNETFGAKVRTDSKTGEMIVSYVDPEAAAAQELNKGVGTINVDQRFINDDAHHNPDGPNWTKGDHQNGYGSPMDLFATGNDQDLKIVSQAGKGAFTQAEKAYYSDPEKWTPDMQEKARQGYRPEDIIEVQAANSWNKVETRQVMGWTPESRKEWAAGMAAMQTARQMGATGFTGTQAQFNERNRAAAAEAERAAQISQLQQWDEADRNPKRPDSTQVPFATAFGPGFAGKPLTSKLPTGWTPAQLLSQPGLSNAQAADIVAQITGGAGRIQVGGAGYGAPGGYGAATGLAFGPQSPGNVVISGGKPPTTNYRPTPITYKNPYMPSPGQVYGGGSNSQSPMAGSGMFAPAPHVAPKPAPSPLYAPGTTAADIAAAAVKPDDYYVPINNTIVKPGQGSVAS